MESPSRSKPVLNRGVAALPSQAADATYRSVDCQVAARQRCPLGEGRPTAGLWRESAAVPAGPRCRAGRAQPEPSERRADRRPHLFGTDTYFMDGAINLTPVLEVLAWV